MITDISTLRLMRSIPQHLIDRGWELSAKESEEVKVGSTGRRRYRAVYARLYDRERDHPPYSRALHDGWIRVSTQQQRSPSWEEARADAIAEMERIDSLRSSD